MMRVPVYMVCAAIIVAVNSEENYYGRPQNSLQALLQGGSASDDGNADDRERDAIGYLLPRLMMAKYSPWRRQWDGYYPTLTDIDTNNIETQMELSQEDRSKRAGRGGLSLREVGGGGPSLSISNSLDVLRNRLLLEMSRKKELEGAHRNRNILCKIGKRGALFDMKRRCEEPAEKYVDDKLGEA